MSCGAGAPDTVRTGLCDITHPRLRSLGLLVGMRGLEPPLSCIQSRWASRCPTSRVSSLATCRHPSDRLAARPDMKNSSSMEDVCQLLPHQQHLPGADAPHPEESGYHPKGCGWQTPCPGESIRTGSWCSGAAGLPPHWPCRTHAPVGSSRLPYPARTSRSDICSKVVTT